MTKNDNMILKIDPHSESFEVTYDENGNKTSEQQGGIIKRYYYSKRK